MALAEKLEELREGSKERIPEKILNEMERAVQELRDSGLAGQAIGSGDRIRRPDALVRTSEHLG